MKHYTIESWNQFHDAWMPVMGCQTQYESRGTAEWQLRFEANAPMPRRCRLVNSKGKVVLHAGCTIAPRAEAKCKSVMK